MQKEVSPARSEDAAEIGTVAASPQGTAASCSVIMARKSTAIATTKKGSTPNDILDHNVLAHGAGMFKTDT